MKIFVRKGLSRSTMRALAAALVISFFAFIGIDVLSGTTVQHAGTVVNKVHIPQSVRVHSNVRTNAKGQSRIYYTTTTQPARWYLYIESLSGKIIPVDCPPEIFYTRPVGQVMPYLITYGRFTGIPYFPRATNNPTHNYEKSQTQGTTSTY